MPKEVICENPYSQPAIEVRWGSEHFDIIQVTVDRDEEFVFVSDEEKTRYTGLTISLQSEESVDRLVKALQRAKRKTRLA